MSKNTDNLEISPEIIRLEDEITKVRGWNKSEFCAAYKISTQNYNNWRKRGIPAKHLLKVANFLGLNHEWLADGHGAKYQKNYVEHISEGSPEYQIDDSETDLKIFKDAFLRVTTSLSNKEMHELIQNDKEEFSEIIYTVFELLRNPKSKTIDYSKILRLIKKK